MFGGAKTAQVRAGDWLSWVAARIAHAQCFTLDNPIRVDLLDYAFAAATWVDSTTRMFAFRRLPRSIGSDRLPACLPSPRIPYHTQSLSSFL